MMKKCKECGVHIADNPLNKGFCSTICMNEYNKVFPVEAGGSHYGKGLQPWDLQRDMQSWGSVFIDARRTDVIEYLFRVKGDKSKRIDDAKKALHNLQEIIKELEGPYK